MAHITRHLIEASNWSVRATCISAAGPSVQVRRCHIWADPVVAYLLPAILIESLPSADIPAMPQLRLQPCPLTPRRRPIGPVSNGGFTSLANTHSRTLKPRMCTGVTFTFQCDNIMVNAPDLRRRMTDILTNFFQGREQGFIPDEDVPYSPGHRRSAIPHPDSAVLPTDGGAHFGSASLGGDDVGTVLSVLVSVCSLDS